MLELHVANNDVSGGSISVGWCVSIDTLKLLADRGYKNPVVVLCTAPAGEIYHANREFRKVVPLKDLIGYVEFLSSGDNYIWGFIAGSEKDAKNIFLDKDRSGYTADILSSNGSEWRYYKPSLSTPYHPFTESEITQVLSEPIKVFVPEECFASEPAEWEKIWVNHFSSRKSIDQCDFRRRRLFAYTIQPVIMLHNILLRFAALLFATLFGLRSWDIKPLLHPLRYSFEDGMNVALNANGTYFVGRGDNPYLNWARLPFMPAFFFLYYILWEQHKAATASIVLLGIVVLVIAALICYKLAWLYADYSEASERRSKAWYLDEKEIPYIVCNAGTKATSLKDLPMAKRTFRLHVQNLKSKICRPFSV